MRAPSMGLPDSNSSGGFLLLTFTACFIGRRSHNEGEKATRLTIKKAQKCLGGSKGGTRWLWGQLVATTITWFPLMGLQLDVEE